MDSLRLAEDQASAKLSLALPAETPGGIRPMEAVWALTALVLFMAHLESSDLSQYVDKKNPERERCEIYTKALTNVLNGGSIEVAGSTRVSCRAKHLGAS